MMAGHVVDDYEITRLRMLGGRDEFGKSRVWICEPFADGDPDPKWSVQHRTDLLMTFPVKIEYAATFEEALRIARALVLVYDAELAHAQEAER